MFKGVSTITRNKSLKEQAYDILKGMILTGKLEQGKIYNEKTIAENPDLVSKMVEVLLQGLVDTILNPDEAYEMSKGHVPNLAEANEIVQKEVLARSIDLWKAVRPGYSDTQAWANMQDTLLKMGLLEEALELDKAFTNDFVP